MLDFAGPCTTCLKLINSFIVHCVFGFKWIYMCQRVGKTNVWSLCDITENYHPEKLEVVKETNGLALVGKVDFAENQNIPAANPRKDVR